MSRLTLVKIFTRTWWLVYWRGEVQLLKQKPKVTCFVYLLMYLCDKCLVMRWSWEDWLLEKDSFQCSIRSILLCLLKMRKWLYKNIGLRERTGICDNCIISANLSFLMHNLTNNTNKYQTCAFVWVFCKDSVISLNLSTSY